MLKDLSIKLHSLTVFRNLLSDPVIRNLLAFLDSAEGDTRLSVDIYASFIKSLYESGFQSLASYVADIASSDENIRIRYITRKEAQ